MTTLVRVTRFFMFTLFLVGLGTEARAELRSIGLVLANNSQSSGKSAASPELEAQAIQATTSAFLATRRFTIAERDVLDLVFKEKDLKGFIGDDEGVDIGETLGLDYIGLLSYGVQEIPGQSPTFLLSIRLINVATAQVEMIVDSRRQGSAVARKVEKAAKNWMKKALLGEVPELGAFAHVVDDSMEAAGQRLLQNLLAVFSPEGYIVDFVGDGQVVIDLGVEDGLSAGDLLQVYIAEPPQIHPVTGEQLPSLEVEQGVVKVVSVGNGLSTCKVKGKKTVVAVGSRVRFMPKNGMVGRLKGSIGRR